MSAANNADSLVVMLNWCGVASQYTLTGDTLGGPCKGTFTFYSTHATDIDECAAGFDTCDPNANCMNVGGNFTCACNTGYGGDGSTCTCECATVGPLY